MRIHVVATLVAALSGTALAGHYQVKVLASNLPDPMDPTRTTDPKLINAWGLAASDTSPWWVADNGAGASTLYDGDGVKQALEVTVHGDPTGLVHNDGTDLPVCQGKTCAPSIFLFASEDGTISAWNPKVAPTDALIVVNRSDKNAVYKGLAIAQDCDGDTRLYATDFHNNRVDVFNGSFHRIHHPFAFRDPFLPKGYAPFGIAVLSGRVLVTYAKQDADAHDDAAGPGRGFVDEFSLDGFFLRRVISRGVLNSPWGLAWAPDEFGPAEHTLLVGNFGDGKIHAFAWRPWGEFKKIAPLRDACGQAIVIDGLWSIKFGNDNKAGPSHTLFFTAGPDHESNGLFGRIDFVGSTDGDGDE